MCSFINAHKSPASALSFSSFNPVLLVSCSLDQTLIFYDINDKKNVKTITVDQSLNSVSFHSDGHTLVAGGMYGGLYIYDLRKPNAPREKLLGHESTVRYVDFLKDREQTSGTAPTATTSTNKYTSILPTSKTSLPPTDAARKEQISTMPVLMDKPQTVVTPITLDKHRSVSKVETTITAQQPARPPLEPSNITIKHSASAHF